MPGPFGSTKYLDQAALERAFAARAALPGRMSRTGALGPSPLNNREYDLPITAWAAPGRALGGPTTMPDLSFTPRPGGWVPPGGSDGPYVPAGGLPGSPSSVIGDLIDRSRGNTGINGGEADEARLYDPGAWGTMRVRDDEGGPGRGPVEPPEGTTPGPNVPPPLPPPPDTGATVPPGTGLTTPPLGAGTTTTPGTGGSTRGQPSPPFTGNRAAFAGFNFDREQNQDNSAKDTFLANAAAGTDDLRWQNSATSAAWFDQYVRPGLEARGYRVGEVRGDRAFISTRENPEGTWIDWVQGIDGPNPLLAWQDQSYLGDGAGGGGGGGAGHGGGGGGDTAGGLGGVDYSMLPSGSNNILQAILGQGVGGGGDQSTLARIMAELQALMRGNPSTLTQPALEQAFGQHQPRTGRL